MTATFRDFDTEEFEPLPPAGEFQLGGQRWRIKNPDDVEVGSLLAAAKVEDGELLFAPGAFFAETIDPAQVAAFNKMLDAPPASVTRRKVRAVMTHIFELVSDFPTPPGSGSSNAPRSTPRKPRSSKARSSSPATRRRASGE